MMSSPLATLSRVRVQLPQQVASTLTSVSPLQSGAWQLQQNCTLEERAAPMCCCSPSPSLSLFFSFFGRQKALHGGCGITRNTLAKGAQEGEGEGGGGAGTGCGCAEIAQFAAIIIFTAHCVDVATAVAAAEGTGGWTGRGRGGAEEERGHARFAYDVCPRCCASQISDGVHRK